jgi:Rieske Fe-S protein
MSSLPTPPSGDPLWRDEFSVYAADERYVSRRQFAKFLTLTSVGMLAGQVWILAKSWMTPKPIYPVVAIASVGDVPVQGVKLFRYPTEHDTCILVRPDAETFVAYSQKCTHLSCAVFYAPARNRLECPCHEGYFAVDSGRVLQGPPPRPLPRILLRREGDTILAVGVDNQAEG